MSDAADSTAAASSSAAERDVLPPGGRRLRVVLYLTLGVLGVLVAIAGALVQAAWFPAGLVLALAAAAGTFWGGAKLCRTKVGAVAPGVGWTLAVIALTAPRAEGDFMFGAGTGSYVFLLGGIFAAVMCATIALPAPPETGTAHRR